MKLFKQLVDGFAALRLRDRVIAIAAVAACLGLGGNLLLIKPQLLQINKLKAQERAHISELSGLQKALNAVREEEKSGIDPLQAQRDQLETMRAEIRQIETFLGGEDSSVSQVGILVRSLIKSNPDLTLVSLKTQPSAIFYTPPAPPQPKAGVGSEIDKVLDSVRKNEEVKPQPFVLVKKPIYKHGVEVNVKGGYPALLSYMKEMQKFPKRIFWAEARLDAKKHREATLRLVVYTLSDQSVAPLN
ncbi:MAG: hypothetical protein Q8M20_15545 [Rhodocyclaceae bacterium]|nr:hypothetical protein [Rhodocyclaceae bacterium]MDZ4215084.1 hypothetical protein [Rhodocyclaceae bacterium]